MKQSTIRRWGPWLALVVVFALATSVLSWWQFSRRAERVERIDQIVSNYDAAPTPYSELSWLTNADGSSPLEWLPVEISGNYLPESALLVRNRPLSGQPGFLQLVPLLLDDGRIFIVERGWIAASSDISLPGRDSSEYQPRGDRRPASHLWTGNHRALRPPSERISRIS
ncbi:MAG: SURF1 family protein [Aquiluna sp.]